MSLRPSRFLNQRASLLFAAVVAVAGALQGQSALEVQELNTTLQVAAQKIKDLEAQLAAAKDKGDAMAQSAAAANQEAAELRERYERLRGLLEGLGIAALENSTDQTQERLLASLSDLRLSESSRRKLADCLMELAEASMQFAKGITNPEPVAGERLSKALSQAETVLTAATIRPGETAAADLQDARVVSLKPDIGVAVLSVGARDGVKPGMPFEIYREDKPIAKILVTEVRNSVSGAVVQELANPADPVQVGDRGKVDTTRSF